MLVPEWSGVTVSVCMYGNHIYNVNIYLTLPNSTRAAKHRKKLNCTFILQWHGNTPFTLRGFRFQYENHSHDNSTNPVTLLFQYLLLSEMFLFSRVEYNRILVEYAYSFLRLIFNTAQSSLITAQMGSVTPYFRPCEQEMLASNRTTAEETITTIDNRIMKLKHLDKKRRQKSQVSRTAMPKPTDASTAQHQTHPHHHTMTAPPPAQW